MTGRTQLPIVYTVVGVLVLGAMSVWLQKVRDARYPLGFSQEETLYLTQRATGRLVFTHRSLAADLYWIRAIQYFGGRTQRAQREAGTFLVPPPALAADPPVEFSLLYPLLDITTTLDPRFNIAYRFGAIFLSEGYPHGPGRPDQAVALLEKALRTSPDKWQFWEDIGFVYYWNEHDYAKAAAAFMRGADIDGSPWWLRSMAATTLAKGGDRNASRLLWRQMGETANNEYARNAARLKLQQLDALEIIERLQKGVDAFSARRGAPVTSWNDLIATGLLPGVPLDPAMVPYEVQEGSKVTVSRQSPLFPLPFEPAARTGGGG
jgi:tetratricopeptide (TPR) repeat protein